MFGTKVTAEEKKKIKAALRVQCAYRCYLARRKAQDQYRSHYRKFYDVNLRQFVYQNRFTQDVDEELPDFFGDSEFPTPRDFAAPPDYCPGRDSTGQGYALIISNNQYPLGKWAPAHAEMDEDFEKIKTVISHDFIGRIRLENCVALKNPTTMEVKDAMKHLRRTCRTDGFLFVYIAAHMINLIGVGDPQNEKETAYFAFRNSIWGKTKEITESCIGIKEMASMLNAIKVRHKTIALNYALAPPPRRALFTSSKQIYPPENMLKRMAELCGCPVIGSCAIGFKLRDYLKGYPGRRWAEPGAPVLSATTPPTHAATTAATAIATSSSSSSSGSGSTPGKASPRQVLPDQSSPGLYALYYSELWEQVMVDLNLPRDRPITRTPRPEPPGPVWEQNEHTGFAIKVDLPSDTQSRFYWRQLLYWRLMRGGAKPANLLRRVVRHRKRVGLVAPRQVSLTFQGHTLFGAAVVAALRGGASQPSNPFVTVQDLFSFIYNHMNTVLDQVASAAGKSTVAGGVEEKDHSTSDVNAYQNKNAKKKKDDATAAAAAAEPKTRGKGGGRDKKTRPAARTGSTGGGSPTSPDAKEASRPPRKFNQTPCLYLPRGEASSYLRYPVCYRCGPPCAPERPYVLEIRSDAVRIQWFPPPFDGVPPSKFRIYMKNVTRNFHHWEEVRYPGDITKTEFLVRNLPIGVSCQFKVAGYNNGGWGNTSEATSFVTPGEEQAEISQDLRWHRVRQGGVLAVLDQMKVHASNRDEQFLGMRVLLGIGLTGCGYKSSKFALAIAQQCLNVAGRFDSDPDLMACVFHTLTWCLHGKAERKVRALCTSQNLEQLVAKQADRFRYHSGVVNSIQGLRAGTLAKYVPPLSEYKHRVLFPKEEHKDESSDGEDDEDDDVQTEKKDVGMKSIAVG